MYFKKSANSGKIERLIKSGIAKGFTGIEIQKSLQSEGLGYRRTNLLQDIKAVKEKEYKKIDKIERGHLNRQEKKSSNVLTNDGYKEKKNFSKPLNRAALPVTKHKEEQLYKDSESKPVTPEPPRQPLNYEKQYHFSKDPEKAQRQKEILTQVIKQAKTEAGAGAEYLRRLKEEKLGYREGNVYDDIRRALTVEHAKSPEKKEAANTFYDKVYVKTRELLKSQGLKFDRKTVNKTIRLWKQASAQLAQDAAAAISDFYLSMYGVQ